MDTDKLSFSSSEVYNLDQTMIIGGSKEQFEFTFYDLHGNLLDITNTKVIWTLSEFGHADFTILEKQGVLSSDYSSLVTLQANDTRNLSGKYVQQITLIDYLGAEYVPAQGIIKINANNKNS